MRDQLRAPRDWTWSKVKHAAQFFTGWTPSTGNSSFFEGDNLWANISDLGSRELSDTAKRISDEAVRLSTIKQSPAGSVLFSFKLSIGQVSFAGRDMYTNEAIATFPPQPSFNARWAYWAFPVFIPQNAGENIYGAKLLNQELIRAADLLLPPSDAQERIANYLDDKTARIDALIAEKEQLVRSLQEYQYSYSSHLMTRGLDERVKTAPNSFPEIGDVPAHWTVTPLKFLGEVRSGVAKGKDLGDKDTITLPYLRVANVQDGYVDLSNVLDIEVSSTEATRYLLRKGDVLMNEGGDNDKLGRGAVWQGQIEPCIHQNHVFAVRLADPELADWVSRFTSTHAARTYFFLRSKQSTNLASINQSNVRELPIPMPPDAERRAVMVELQRIAKSTTDLIEHAVEHIARLREYRSSLISATVTGQLDVGQTTPMPASDCKTAPQPKSLIPNPGLRPRLTNEVLES